MRRTGIIHAQVGSCGQPWSMQLQCCRKERGRPVGKAIGVDVLSFLALIVFGSVEGRYMRACRCLNFAIPEILNASNLAGAGCNSILHKVVLCGPVVKNSCSIMVECASSCFWYIRSCRESLKQILSCLLFTWHSKISRCLSNNNNILIFFVSKTFMLHSCYPTAICIVPEGTADNLQWSKIRKPCITISHLHLSWKVGFFFAPNQRQKWPCISR